MTSLTHLLKHLVYCVAMVAFCMACFVPLSYARGRKASVNIVGVNKIAVNKVSIDKVWVRQTFRKNGPLVSALQPVRAVFVGRDLVVQGNRINGVHAYTRKWGKKRWSLWVKGGVAGDLLFVPSDISGERKKSAKSKKENKKYRGYLIFGGADGFIYAVFAQTGQVFWKQFIGSAMFSQPVLHKNRIYIAQVGKLYCLKARTGEVVWTYRVRLKKPEFIVEGIATPLVTPQWIYFKSGDGVLSALNHKGRRRWKVSLSRKEDRFTSALSAPVMGKLCLYSAGFESGLYCLNKNTGAVIWKTTMGSHGDVVLDGNRLFYPTSNGKVLALDQKSGKKIWEHQVPHSIATDLSLYKHYLVYGEFSGALRLLSKKDGALQGAFFFGKGLSAKPLVSLADKALYFISNYGWLYKVSISLKQV